MADPYETYQTFNELADGGDSATGEGISFTKIDDTSKASISIQDSLKNFSLPFAIGRKFSYNQLNCLFQVSDHEDSWKLVSTSDEWMKMFADLSDDDKAKVAADIGDCKLPVEQLVKLSTPAPFGKGSETVIDETVRKATEIPADAFPPKLFDDLSDIIKPYLDWNFKPSDATWKLKLYKMHIYREGGKFERHVDTLHGSNHVATLVVGLGTQHEGGDLVVTHQDRETVFSLSPTEEKDKDDGVKHVDWVAFYTDCHHEVREVTKGWRVVLQYDIYETSVGEKAGGNTGFEEKEDR